MPVSATVSRLGLVALSVIVRVPVRVPVAVGVNVISRVQLAPAATLPPQLSVSAKSSAFVPPTARLEMVKVVVPLLPNVTVCGVAVVPTA